LVLDGTLTLVIDGESICQISFRPFERTWLLILKECSEDLVLTVVPDSASREDRGDRLPYRQWARPEIRTIGAVVENERVQIPNVAALTPARTSTVRGSPEQESIGKEFL
jgi:hypothetical protein